MTTVRVLSTAILLLTCSCLQAFTNLTGTWVGYEGGGQIRLQITMTGTSTFSGTLEFPGADTRVRTISGSVDLSISAWGTHRVRWTRSDEFHQYEGYTSESGEKGGLQIAGVFVRPNAGAGPLETAGWWVERSTTRNVVDAGVVPRVTASSSDVTGIWVGYEGGNAIIMSLQQQGSSVTGTLRFLDSPDPSKHALPISGTVRVSISAWSMYEFEWTRSDESHVYKGYTFSMGARAGQGMSGYFTRPGAGPIGRSGWYLTRVTSSLPGSSSSADRLANLSVRAQVRPGAPAIPGFVLAAPARVLIRAAGPGLAAFGVPGTLADPTLTVFRGTSAIANNDDWASSSSNRTAVMDAASRTGAFAFTSGSLDSAVVLDLAAGAYTASVSGLGSGTGEVLIEVYRVP